MGFELLISTGWPDFIHQQSVETTGVFLFFFAVAFFPSSWYFSRKSATGHPSPMLTIPTKLPLFFQTNPWIFKSFRYQKRRYQKRRHQAERRRHFPPTHSPWEKSLGPEVHFCQSTSRFLWGCFFFPFRVVFLFQNHFDQFFMYQIKAEDVSSVLLICV